MGAWGEGWVVCCGGGGGGRLALELALGLTGIGSIPSACSSYSRANVNAVSKSSGC